ncbi:MAG TPA: glycosyltransferase family 39 protein, partial [Chloroflexota bacterium]|nr:glycosyltransferase family 39 protein [Chloroflexota bacterium]
MKLAAWAGLLAIALALRLSLLVRSGWLLEGDDALSALMAFDVLDGARPIMLKNQTYAAAWEPYAMAVSYTLFGVSRVSAKLPALLGSLACIGTSWFLARAVAGTTAAWFAAAFAALPPIYVLVLGLKPWAPYTEVILLGSLCLWCAIRLSWPPKCQRVAWWAFGCGVAGGVALWMHPLAIWYLTAATLTLLVRVRGRHWLSVAPAGFVGVAVGALPVWLFNVQTGFATFRFVVSGSQGQTANRLEVLRAWWNNDLPRGAGLWHPWGESPGLFGPLMAFAVGAALLWAVLGRRQPAVRPLDALLVLLVSIPTLFVLSGFGGPALNPYGFDATGRYAPPIWSALAVILGAALAAAWRVRRWLALALALVALGVNAAAFAVIDPLQAFQSPYWERLPVSNASLLRTLDAEQVSAVWMNHWAAQPLMFDARAIGQPLIAYDWYDVEAGGIDRFPEYRPLVEQAAKPAFVLITDEPEPVLVPRLRELGVTFVVERVAPY